MKIIIQTSSMIPIYEQIVQQIKALILHQDIQENEALPSVRSLSKDLKISALTVKKAYDTLEEEGFTKTIHGKGTYVCHPNPTFMKEEILKEIESEFEQIIQKAHHYHLTDEEIQNIFTLTLEDSI